MEVSCHSHKYPRCLKHFSSAGLAAGMGFGAAEEFIRRSTTSGESSNGSLFMSEANVSRFVDKLSRMRGAALKLGQFLSIQGNPILLSHYHIHLTVD
jgi:aarF domain-containing kinase